MRVLEQIVYFGRLHGLVASEASRRANRWIERLQLQEYAKRPCAELSKGNQQKVQVACAAVHDPELLVLDEPFSGLDPVNAEMILKVLDELKAAGVTLVLSSHQMWQLEELCDRFCIIAAGETVASGTLADLRKDWPTRIVRVAPATGPVRAVLEAQGGSRYLQARDGAIDYEMPSRTDFAALLRSLINAEAITQFEAMEPSLHELYLHAIGAVA
jgi:ABC-2 type transport system ATP-binding protein